jgi:hypothetical protein
VVFLFGIPATPLVLAGGILVFAVSLIGLSGFREFQPLIRELTDRWNLISGLGGGGTVIDRLAVLDKRFSTTSPPIPALTLGWANYRSLLVETDDGVTTSVRAADAFTPLDASAAALEWWANILVAVGLVITFLGIVAALSAATAAIGGGDPGGSAVQNALMGLLAIAATKFWTSIAGVLASLILRIVARFRRQRIAALEAYIFHGLDEQVRFAPAEKVLLEQLKALNRLETALGVRQKVA